MLSTTGKKGWCCPDGREKRGGPNFAITAWKRTSRGCEVDVAGDTDQRKG